MQRFYFISTHMHHIHKNIIFLCWVWIFQCKHAGIINAAECWKCNTISSVPNNIATIVIIHLLDIHMCTYQCQHLANTFCSNLFLLPLKRILHWSWFLFTKSSHLIWFSQHNKWALFYLFNSCWMRELLPWIVEIAKVESTQGDSQPFREDY